MSSDIVAHGGSDLTIQQDQSFWNEKQVAALRQLGVKDATNGDLAVFFHHSQRTGLDPFLKQIYMIGRWSSEGTKQTIQTGIDGFRLIARRAADRAGATLGYEDTAWCGPDGEWREVWLAEEPPAAARVVVLRGRQRYPAVALWREYVQQVKDKKTGELKPNSMWAGMPSNQLAKCAEALALRKAFPQDLSGIYADEEMGPAARTQVRQVPQQRTRVTAAEITGELEAAAEPPTSLEEADVDTADPDTGVIDAEVVVDEPWPPTAEVER